MDQQVKEFSKRNLRKERVVQANRKTLLVTLFKPEVEWSNQEQAIVGRTCICCKILGRLLVRGERPIKLGYLWFSAKSMYVKYQADKNQG